MASAWTDISVIQLTDLLLLTLLRRRGTALLVEPVGREHAVIIEEGVQAMPLAQLPPPLGDALVARLAVLAELHVGHSEQQLGRVRLRAGDQPDQEFLLMVRASRLGLEAEVRRLWAATSTVGGGDKIADEVTTDQRIGAYRLLGEIGHGGVGVVYRAEHILLRKPVAIKILRAKWSRDAATAARFLREARVAGRTHHPGVVSVTDFGTLPDGRAFFVMELIEGSTLEALLWEGPVNPPRATELARQVASALEAVHTQGVVHGDLKPGNVLVGLGDVAKISDFGAAWIGNAPTPEPSQEFLGTPLYMSPEQARGETCDRRADLYALGCVLFHMLAGHPPFSGATPQAILQLHATGAIPPVTCPHGELPAVFQEIIQRALAKERAARYQTAREFLDDLQRAAAMLERTGWRRWLPL